MTTAFLLLLALFGRLASAGTFAGCSAGSPERCPGTANCTVKYIDQYIDHFNWAAPLGGQQTTYRQRYFVADQWWQAGGPIFFYFGNEDNVELYVNHTGLMWENAKDFGAMMVWAEHRYYGESLPFAPGVAGCMSWLTTEQALADFAYLIDHLQASYGQGRRLPVVGFGGSYGGMMAAWFRIKYTQHVDGVISGSAPIWSFVGLQPPYDFNSFNQAVTFDASSAGGSSDRCKLNLKAAWPRVLAAGRSESGRQVLETSFRTCEPVRPPGPEGDDSYNIMQWAMEPWAYLAMGNYPYASSYIMHGNSLLPPWPLRAACQHLDKDLTSDAELFSAVREAVAIYYNSTQDKACFDLRAMPGLGHTMLSQPIRLSRQRSAMRSTQEVAPAQQQECKGDWGYQWCTEIVQPFTQGTAKDMFFCPNGTFYKAENCSHWDFEAQAKNCEQQWGVRPRKNWARIALSGTDLSAASNIVFSPGSEDEEALRWLASKRFFAVLGAMKSGTCSLRSHLNKNAWDAWLSLPWQELHFFDEDQAFNQGPGYYKQWFEWRWGAPEVLGDITPSYLYIPSAVPRLHAMFPRAKLVVLLRNPIDRALSHHNHDLAKGRQFGSLRTRIEQELAVETPATRSDVFRRGLYHQQLQHVLQYFPRDQLLVVISERYRRDTARQLRRVQDFVGLPQSSHDSLPECHVRGEYFEHLSGGDRAFLQLLYLEDVQHLKLLLGDLLPEWADF